MQKRANPARVGQRRFAAILVGLALVGSAAGSLTVESERTCYGEAMAQVVAPIVRHGPNGSAAEFSTSSGGSGEPAGPRRRSTSDLIKAVRALDNLEAAWRLIQSNGRGSRSDGVRLELERFAENAPNKLRSLKGKLSRASFKFEPAKGVPVPKLDSRGRPTGKIRPLVLAPVESRIVQRAILNVLIRVPALQPFIKTPYSFGGIRGERGFGPQRVERSESHSAVPAAIRAVLDGIQDGGRFVACADIRSFFTRISKQKVLGIVASAVEDEPFMKLFREAIDVELSNMAQLRERASEFPTEDIGVAQGNSLSPLLGNIILAEFDKAMNEGDCRCIRYIDDFIILAPSKKAADVQLRKAKCLLANLNMELSPEKSSAGGFPVETGFDFLGINVCPGLIRPSRKAQTNITTAVEEAFKESIKLMRGLEHTHSFDPRFSLASTLKRVDGIIDGWGKHYWFCNDRQSFANVDRKVGELIGRYLGEYGSVRDSLPAAHRQKLLGITELMNIPREPFLYPATAKTHRVPRPDTPGEQADDDAHLSGLVFTKIK